MDSRGGRIEPSRRQGSAQANELSIDLESGAVLLVEQILLVAGCAIFVYLGGLHLGYTLFTDKFLPRDPALMVEMQRVSPVLTRRVTMWKAWIGFNLTHSLGAILFGVMYIAIALENYTYLRASIALGVILLVFPLSVLATLVKYGFSAPRKGILAATVLIALSMALRTIG